MFFSFLRIENIVAEQQEERDVEDDGSDGGFSSSGSKTLQKCPATLRTTDVQLDLSTLTCVRGICNNFLLQQDPLTGHLTLLPVHISVLQPITGREALNGEQLKKKSTKPSFENIDNKSDCAINRESSVSPETQCVTSHIIHLIRHQFDFDGHVEKDDEDLAVGNSNLTF